MSSRIEGSVQNIHLDLCNSCGVCSGICPNNCITMTNDTDRGILYPKVDTKRCSNCGLCLQVCSGRNANFEEMKPKEWNLLKKNKYIGNYLSTYVGFSNNNKIRYNGSSGGVLTSFLIYILDNNLVDGVVVSKMKNGEPLTVESFIARTKEEIISAQTSIYCPVPLGKVLREIEKEDIVVAIVGLPCHLQAIRKIQELNPKYKKKIKMLIGLFCSRTPSYNATKYLMQKNKIPMQTINYIKYRGNGHPGHMSVYLKNGKVKKIPHLNFDYWGYMFYNFFIPTRCFLCVDKVAAIADISFGDNWTKLLKTRKGSSTIVTRSLDCQQILNEMKVKNIVTLRKVSTKEIISSQALEKKCRVAPKMLMWKLLDGKVPEYGELTVIKEKSLRDYIFTIPAFMKFLLSRTRRNFKMLQTIAQVFYLIEKLIAKIIIFKKKIKYCLNIFINKKPLKYKDFNFKKSKKKVVILGGYGWKDIGDEAMPHTDILNMKTIIDSNLDIVMLSPYPKNTKKFHKEYSILDFQGIYFIPSTNIKFILKNIQVLYNIMKLIFTAIAYRWGIALPTNSTNFKVIREIASCDAVFNVGGGNLNSIMPKELYKKCFTYIIASILRKPVIVSGQTIGPFTNKLDKYIVRICLNKVQMITLRDKDVSRKRLSQIKVNKPIMKDTADDAITLPSITRQEAINILQKEVGKEWLDMPCDLLVAMNLKGSMKYFNDKKGEQNLKNSINLMAHIADKLIDDYNAKVVFIPTDYTLGVDDRELHVDILKRMKNKEYVKVITGEYNDSELKGLIGLFDIAIGSRYHFCVFAASMVTPFCGIAFGQYQMTKLKGLAELCEVPGCYIEKDMNILSMGETWKYIEYIVEHKFSIQGTLQKMIPILQKKSLISINKLAIFLK